MRNIEGNEFPHDFPLKQFPEHGLILSLPATKRPKSNSDTVKDPRINCRAFEAMSIPLTGQALRHDVSAIDSTAGECACATKGLTVMSSTYSKHFSTNDFVQFLKN